MKYRLPYLLVSALVAPFCSHTASADVIGNGVCYDVGKAAFSNAPGITSKLDGVFCWVAGASNIIQYWQDTYKGLADAGISVPNGTNAEYGEPAGTLYLDIYKKAYACGTEDQTTHKYMSGYPGDFIAWWMKGTANEGLKSPAGFKGYYNTLFPGADTATYGIFNAAVASGQYVEPTCFGDPATFKGNTDGVPGGDNKRLWAEMSDFLKGAFSVQGRALALNIRSSHIITCWGYETDAAGVVTALILTDSDDGVFGPFRGRIEIGNTDASAFDGGVYISFGERLMISTDDQSALKYPIGLQLDGSKPVEKGSVWLTSFTYIDTPKGKTAKKTAPAADLPAKGAVTENILLTGDKVVRGRGITVGSGREAVVLTAQKDKTLSLDGGKSAHTGIKVSEGAMVSLSRAKVSRYTDSGIKSAGKTYFHDGEVALCGNSAAKRGGAVDNTNYLEFLNCAKVTVSDNAAGGKGGAICNTKGGTVSLRGNREVVFSSNSASGGANDIYNAADCSLNIADNDSVVFQGSGGQAAIVNEGNLYLRVRDGKAICFQDSALNSDKGTTYIGKDILYRENNIRGHYIFDTNGKNGGKVEFKDSASRTTSVQRHAGGAPGYATLEHVNVSAASICGAGKGGGTIKCAHIVSNGGLSVSHLTLDSTSTIESKGKAAIVLDQVQLKLTKADMKNKTFNLTGILRGNMKLGKLTIDLSGTNLSGADLNKLVFDMSTVHADKASMQVFLKTKEGSEYELSQAGSRVQLAPQPLP